MSLKSGGVDRRVADPAASSRAWHDVASLGEPAAGAAIETSGAGCGCTCANALGIAAAQRPRNPSPSAAVTAETPLPSQNVGEARGSSTPHRRCAFLVAGWRQSRGTSCLVHPPRAYRRRKSPERQETSHRIGPDRWHIDRRRRGCT